MTLAYQIEAQSNSNQLTWIEDEIDGTYRGLDRSTKEVHRVLAIIKEEAFQWFLEEFGYKPEIQILIDGRKQKANGVFRRYTNSRTGELTKMNISMSGRFMRHVHVACLLKTLKHELVHYHLYTQGRDFSDGTREFEALMEKYELPSNYTKKNKAHPWYYSTNRYGHYKETQSSTRIEDLI